LIAVHDRCPCEAVSRPRVILERREVAVLGCACSESGPEVVFCTHTQTHPPTLSSAHTNINVVRQQKCACTEKKILDDPCTPVNHNPRMHKGKRGQASRHKQDKSWPR